MADSRLSFIRQKLGNDQADELEKWLQQGRKILDRRGIAKKEHGKTKGIMEDMAAEVDTLLAAVTEDDALREELRNKLIAVIMGALSEAGSEIEAEAPPAELPGEEATPVAEQVMELAAKVAVLADENTAMVKELQGLVPALVDMAKAVVRVAPIAEGLETRVKAVETLLRAQPRAASTAAETVVKNAAVQQDMAKSQHGQIVELGLPVTRKGGSES